MPKFLVEFRVLREELKETISWIVLKNVNQNKYEERFKIILGLFLFIFNEIKVNK